jgi:hypothetical protein
MTGRVLPRRDVMKSVEAGADFEDRRRKPVYKLRFE